MSTHQSVRSFVALRKFKFGAVEISRSGSMYKARWPGERSFVFGATSEEAEQRLRSGRLPRGKPHKT